MTLRRKGRLLEEKELHGYRLYVVVQWMYRPEHRSHVVVPTGSDSDVVLVQGIECDANELPSRADASQQLSLQLKEEQGGLLAVCDRGRLSGSLTLIHVASGDFDAEIAKIEADISLARLGCGRLDLSLNDVGDAQFQFASRYRAYLPEYVAEGRSVMASGELHLVEMHALAGPGRAAFLQHVNLLAYDFIARLQQVLKLLALDTSSEDPPPAAHSMVRGRMCAATMDALDRFQTLPEGASSSGMIAVADLHQHGTVVSPGRVVRLLMFYYGKVRKLRRKGWEVRGCPFRHPERVEEAVSRYQRSRGLPVTARLDERTRISLDEKNAVEPRNATPGTALRAHDSGGGGGKPSSTGGSPPPSASLSASAAATTEPAHSMEELLMQRLSQLKEEGLGGGGKRGETGALVKAKQRTPARESERELQPQSSGGETALTWLLAEDPSSYGVDAATFESISGLRPVSLGHSSTTIAANSTASALSSSNASSSSIPISSSTAVAGGGSGPTTAASSAAATEDSSSGGGGLELSGYLAFAVPQWMVSGRPGASMVVCESGDSADKLRVRAYRSTVDELTAAQRQWQESMLAPREPGWYVKRLAAGRLLLYDRPLLLLSSLSLRELPGLHVPSALSCVRTHATLDVLGVPLEDEDDGLDDGFDEQGRPLGCQAVLVRRRAHLRSMYRMDLPPPPSTPLMKKKKKKFQGDSFKLDAPISSATPQDSTAASSEQEEEDTLEIEFLKGLQHLLASMHFLPLGATASGRMDARTIDAICRFRPADASGVVERGPLDVATWQRIGEAVRSQAKAMASRGWSSVRDPVLEPAQFREDMRRLHARVGLRDGDGARDVLRLLLADDTSARSMQERIGAERDALIRGIMSLHSHANSQKAAYKALVSMHEQAAERLGRLRTVAAEASATLAHHNAQLAEDERYFSRLDRRLEQALDVVREHRYTIQSVTAKARGMETQVARVERAQNASRLLINALQLAVILVAFAIFVVSKTADIVWKVLKGRQKAADAFVELADLMIRETSKTASAVIHPDLRDAAAAAAASSASEILPSDILQTSTEDPLVQASAKEDGAAPSSLDLLPPSYPAPPLPSSSLTTSSLTLDLKLSEDDSPIIEFDS